MKSLRKVLTCLPFALMLQLTAQAGVLKDHQGRWMGDLKIPNGPTLKMGVDIFARADGSIWATFSVPDQDAYNTPVASIKETGSNALFDLGFGAMSLTWNEDRPNGEWKQGGATFPMELKSVADFPRRMRPQDPVRPVPYKEEALAIRSRDGVMLGATLSIPNGVSKPNVVILVHGSGPQTRDEENFGHRTFSVLNDYLARQGVAVLRYDKRGIMRSTGDYEHHTQPQLADDLSAITDALRARKQFQRIGVIGHSEGPQIAASVAAQHPKSMDFLVSLAGVGLPGTELILLQDRLSARDKGANQLELDRLASYERAFYETVISQADSEKRIVALKQLLSGLSAEDSALVQKYKMNQGTLSLDWAEKPMERVLLMADPRNDWMKVRCPVLVLNGSLDHQVPVESLDGIVTSLRKGGNKKVEAAILPSLNHMFQTAKTGAENEYVKIDETIAPIALERITKFIKEQP